MVALAVGRKTQRRVRPADHYWDYPRGGSTIYHGALVGVLAGKVVPASADSAIKVMGRASVKDSISSLVADENIRVEEGVSRWVNDDAIAVTDIGQPCFAVDDQTVALSSNGGARPFAGVIMDVDTLGVWVFSTMDLAGAVDAGLSLGTLHFPINGFQEADGTALADFADGDSVIPGYDFTASEAWGIRWNNHANPDPIAQAVGTPFDMDTSKPITVYYLASKVGATIGDAVIWDTAVFILADGDLHDADVDAGGESSAMTGDAATKTMQVETLAVLAADLKAAPAVISLNVQPKDGTLGTDDVILHAVFALYTRKVG